MMPNVATKCWSCLVGHCPGGRHSWKDPIEGEGIPDDSDPHQICGCSCVNGEELTILADDVETVRLYLDPCAVCGESGACGHDSEGRPLIHAEGYRTQD